MFFTEEFWLHTRVETSSWEGQHRNAPFKKTTNARISRGQNKMARVSLEEIQTSDGKRRKRKGHLAIKSDCHYYPDGAVSTRVGCLLL